MNANPFLNLLHTSNSMFRTSVKAMQVFTRIDNIYTPQLQCFLVLKLKFRLSPWTSSKALMKEHYRMQALKMTTYRQQITYTRDFLYTKEEWEMKD